MQTASHLQCRGHLPGSENAHWLRLNPEESYLVIDSQTGKLLSSRKWLKPDQVIRVMPARHCNLIRRQEERVRLTPSRA
jgi:3-mercaptopyruvate sulfurtransferase SseA